MAQIYKDKSNWQAAEVALQDYLRYANLLRRFDPDNPESWLEQSYAHNNLGALAQSRGQPSLAAPEFAASIELKRRVLARAPEASSVAADLADSYSWLASARASLGELSAAETLYEREMSLVQALHERFPSESIWVYREVHAFQHHATIATALGHDEAAMRDYNTARIIFNPLVEREQKNLGWQFELAGMEQDRLRLLARKTDVLAFLNALHGRFQDLRARDPKNVAWAKREVVAHLRMAAALPLGGKEQQQALNTLRPALQAIHDANRSDLPIRLVLVEALLLTAKMQKQENNAASLLSCRQAYGMIEREGFVTMDYRILDPWVRINLCLKNNIYAKAAMKRLDAIGYRDRQYIQLISARN